jgi:hypothetical protein
MIRHPNKGYVSESDGRVVHPRPLFPGAKLRQFLKILRIAHKRYEGGSGKGAETRQEWREIEENCRLL